MTTIKAKFRPSKINGKKGAVYYLITSNCKQRQVPSTHKATAEEWDSRCQWLESELRLLRRVTQSLSDKNFTIDEIAEECRKQCQDNPSKVFLWTKSNGNNNFHDIAQRRHINRHCTTSCDGMAAMRCSTMWTIILSKNLSQT